MIIKKGDTVHLSYTAIDAMYTNAECDDDFIKSAKMVARVIKVYAPDEYGRVKLQLRHIDGVTSYRDAREVIKIMPIKSKYVPWQKYFDRGIKLIKKSIGCKNLVILHNGDVEFINNKNQYHIWSWVDIVTSNSNAWKKNIKLKNLIIDGEL